ncbi:MAG TPA: sigma-70 family RNA polymerase sigma factor [Candidatus Angelobacter sp.]|jgi:RNA polymerase sigma-70 factor (ECF subfamily)|nr:sigma-70 family RNA polymerase sigma factor [Candidatus Angelobacter sp.]
MAAKVTYAEVQEFYQRHGPALLAYAIGLLGNRASAEDALHQVFLSLLSKADRPAEATPYLFKAVRNRALNSRRSGARMVSLDDHDQQWLVKPQGMMEAGIEVERALRDLPPEQREVVLMRVWGEMTFDEIAGVLDVSQNTVASRYRYALGKLREILKVEAE